MSTVASDWNSGTLDDLMTHETKGVDPSDADGLPYVGLEHIDTGEMSLARLGEPTAVRSRKTLFETGDILYGKLRPYLDKAVLTAGPGICSTDILVLRPKSGIDPYFAGALLHLKPFVAHAVATTSGVNHPRTSWNAIRRYEVAVPPLPEQQAIAQVLRTVQRAKEATEQVIAAAQELKKSLIGHLLAYGPISPEKSVERADSAVGAMPADWPVELLEQVVDSGGGRLQTGPFGSLLHAEEYQSQGVPFVMPKNMDSSGGIELAGVARISEEAADRLGRYRAEPGDVLVARRGEIGRRAVVPSEGRGWVCGSGSILVSTGDRLESAFLSVFLEHPRTRLWLLNNSVGATMANLSTRILSALPVPVPSRDVQSSIASSVAVVDRKIAAEEARRDALATLFDSLLHDLMTAKLRVTDLIPEVA